MTLQERVQQAISAMVWQTLTLQQQCEEQAGVIEKQRTTIKELTERATKLATPADATEPPKWTDFPPDSGDQTNAA